MGIYIMCTVVNALNILKLRGKDTNYFVITTKFSIFVLDNRLINMKSVSFYCGKDPISGKSQ